MKFYKLFITVSLIISFFLIPVNPAFAEVPAQDKLIVSQKIYPDSNLYTYKRFWEKVRGIFTFSSKGQIMLHKTLLANRVSELKYVSDSKLLSLMQDASQRVSYEAGNVEEKAFGLSDSQQKNDTRDLFAAYKMFLPQIRDMYEANSAYWLFIQQNIDTFGILSNELK